MKLNFLKVLNTSKTTTDEIAVEIVVLENTRKQCEQELVNLRERAKDLRKRRLCGEAITDADIKDADRKTESTQLDLEAIDESLVKLSEKLVAALQAMKDGGVEESQRQKMLIETERLKALNELAKAKAHLIVAGEIYVGTWAEDLAKSGRLFDYDPETHELYRTEIERLRSQVKHPTYHEKKQSVDQYARWTCEMDVDDEARSLVSKQRQRLSEKQQA
jgi:hypothetical protein